MEVGDGRIAGNRISEKEGEDVDPEPEEESIVAPSLRAALAAYERDHIAEGGDQIKEKHRRIARIG